MGTIISSGSGEASRALAKASGTTHVFDYRKDDVAAEIAKLTNGKGVDLVYDTTYNEASFVATAGMVRPGGLWVDLGVGPGKTSRRVETKSPVADILAAKGASLINVNLIRTFIAPARLTIRPRPCSATGLKTPRFLRRLEPCVRTSARLSPLKWMRSTPLSPK